MTETYEQLRELGVTEMGLSLLIMRDPRVTAELLAARMSQWFGLPVCPGDIDLCCKRMMSRGWLVRLDDGSHAIGPALRALTYRSLGGLVRIVDHGRGVWDAAAILTLIDQDLKGRTH